MVLTENRLKIPTISNTNRFQNEFALTLNAVTIKLVRESDSIDYRYSNSMKEKLEIKLFIQMFSENFQAIR